MKFTMHIPVGHTDPGQFQSIEAIGQMARALEAAGVDACYVTDHPSPDANWLRQGMGHDALDPFTALAFVAATSTRLKLHTNIVVLPYRNPFITAKAAATLQVLSGGRLLLGVAAGYQKVEFDALGVDVHRRGALTDDYLETIRLAWAGGALTRRGEGYDAVGVEPRPAPDPPPLIWVGGGSDSAVERAARFGDGWSPFLANPNMSKVNAAAAVTSVAQLSEKVRAVHALRDRLGKTGPFDIVFELGGQHHPASHTRDEADRFLEKLGEFAAAGVTWTCLQPKITDRAAYLDTVQWFGEEVIARA